MTVLTWTQTSSNLNSTKYAMGGDGNRGAAICIGGDHYGSDIIETEVFNGSSWSVVSSMNYSRQFLAAGGSPSAAFATCGQNMYVGGSIKSTELYNGTTWAISIDCSTARKELAGGGSPSAAIIMGGQDGVQTYDLCETFNGSAWSTQGSLTAVTQDMGGHGDPTNAIIAGGIDDIGVTNTTQIWSGSAWSNTGTLNTSRQMLVVGGSSTNALSATGMTATGYWSNATELFNGSTWSVDSAFPMYCGYGAGNGNASTGIIFGGRASAPLYLYYTWTALASNIEESASLVSVSKIRSNFEYPIEISESIGSISGITANISALDAERVALITTISSILATGTPYGPREIVADSISVSEIIANAEYEIEKAAHILSISLMDGHFDFGATIDSESQIIANPELIYEAHGNIHSISNVLAYISEYYLHTAANLNSETQFLAWPEWGDVYTQLEIAHITSSSIVNAIGNSEHELRALLASGSSLSSILHLIQDCWAAGSNTSKIWVVGTEIDVPLDIILAEFTVPPLSLVFARVCPIKDFTEEVNVAQNEIIFKGQSMLRLQITTNTPISGAQELRIKYKKPSGVTGHFSATSIDDINGVLIRDIIDNSEIDEQGDWTIWPWVKFSDGRDAPGFWVKMTIIDEPGHELTRAKPVKQANPRTPFTYIYKKNGHPIAYAKLLIVQRDEQIEAKTDIHGKAGPYLLMPGRVDIRSLDGLNHHEICEVGG